VKRKRTPKQKAMDEADKWFSLYIRLKNADWRGYCTCYTCDKVAMYNEGMQNGHFVSRGSHNLRFEEKNCRVQCVGCNVYKNGNYIQYTLRLIKEKGKPFVNRLIKSGKETKTLMEEDLLKIADKYKKLVKKMQ
jgi:uncharacterized membrane protein